MEDHEGYFRLIKVIKFNSKKEDWTEFALKFIAIANERGYNEILEGTVNVPRDTDMTGGEESARIKAAKKRFQGFDPCNQGYIFDHGGQCQDRCPMYRRPASSMEES